MQSRLKSEIKDKIVLKNRTVSMVFNGALTDGKSMVAHLPDNKCMWFDKTGESKQNVI